jgi:hypothetical protein
VPFIVLWVCWRYPGSFSIGDTGKSDGRESLTYAFFLPGCALAVVARMYAPVLDFTQVLVPSAFLFVAILIPTIRITPEYRARFFVFMLAALHAIGYAFGVVTLANTVFDHAPPQQTNAVVQGKKTDYQTHLHKLSFTERASTEFAAP